MKKIVKWVSLVFIVILSIILLIASPALLRYRFSMSEAQNIINRVGCDAFKQQLLLIAKENEPSESKGNTHNFQLEEIFGKLKIETVFADDQGIWIWMSHFFVQGEGIFIAHSDSDEYKEQSDPFFENVCPAVWYVYVTG